MKMYDGPSPHELEATLRDVITAAELAEASFRKWIKYDLEFQVRSRHGYSSWSGTSRAAGEEAGRPGDVEGVSFHACVVDVSDVVDGDGDLRLVRRYDDDPETGALTLRSEDSERECADPEKDEKNYLPFTEERWATIVALRSQFRRLHEGLDKAFGVSRKKLLKQLDAGMPSVLALPSHRDAE